MVELGKSKMAVLLLVLVVVGLAVIAQLSLKKGMTKVGAIEIGDLLTSKVFSIITEKFVVIGLLLYFVASALWVVILSKEELSFAYPLIALGYIFTAVLASLLFNESLTLFRIVGILSIALGVFLIVIKI